MAARIKLPMGRVPSREEMEAKFREFCGSNERVVLIDMERAKQTKAFAQIRAQAAEWDEATSEDFLLSLVAQGVM